MSELRPRAREILMALCRDFVIQGRPISSKKLQEGHGLAWSPATIRNELKALEEAGWVRKPHSASGRVPTAAGLRVYVAAIAEREAAEPEARVQRVFDAGLSGERGAQGRLSSTTRLLSELSGCVAIAFFGQPRVPVVAGVELIAVGPGRALLVTTTRGGARSVRRVHIDEGLAGSSDALGALEGQLNQLVAGRTLVEARAHLLELIRHEEATLDGWLAAAVRMGLALCAGLALDPLWLQVAGQPTLAAIHGGEGGDGGSALARTLEALEDYQRLAHLLCQLLPEGEAGPRVEIGLGPDLMVPPQRVGEGGLALVGCRVAPPKARALSGAETGVVALLGPSWMDYARVIPLVEYAARAVAERG